MNCPRPDDSASTPQLMEETQSPGRTVRRLKGVRAEYPAVFKSRSSMPAELIPKNDGRLQTFCAGLRPADGGRNSGWVGWLNILQSHLQVFTAQ